LPTLEDKLRGWTGPSSDSEQEKQERTERMVREAISAHEPFNDCSITVFTKGSYPNNTNVKTDSDVDVAVQCHEVVYWEAESSDANPGGESYEGIWTPEKLRSELETALVAKFPSHVDTSGSTAIRIHSNSSRVDADVVPCFDYKYYFNNGGTRSGSKTFRKNGGSIINYRLLARSCGFGVGVVSRR
jgi:hypothetical protein